MLTHDIYDMVLTIADRAVTDIHLDRKLRATLLAADETARSEIACMLSDELAMHLGLPDGCHVPFERIQRFIPSRLWAHWSRLMRRASSVLAEGSAPRVGLACKAAAAHHCEGWGERGVKSAAIA